MRRCAATSPSKVSHDLLQINHYFTKSQAERDAKLKTRIPYSGGPRPSDGVAERDATLNATLDDRIAELYADRVRAALGMPARAHAGERTAWRRLDAAVPRGTSIWSASVSFACS